MADWIGVDSMSVPTQAHVCKPTAPGERIDADGWGYDPRSWVANWADVKPPPRLEQPSPFLSGGRTLAGIVYMVGWRDAGLVKIGSTRTGGDRRYRTYMRSGGELIALAHYRYPDECYAEVWLQKWAGARYASPFCRAECAATFLGRSSGAGWTEFFAVPTDDWPLLDAALGVAHG